MSQKNGESKLEIPEEVIEYYGSGIEIKIRSLAEKMISNLKTEYDFVKFLGLGSYGVVLQFKHNTDQKQYAIKGTFNNKKHTIPRALETNQFITDELEKCGATGKFLLENEPIIFEEKINNIKVKHVYFRSEVLDGTLYDLVKSAYDNPNVELLDENIIKNIICQLIYGIYCIHHLKFIHGDIKHENIFYKENVQFEENGETKKLPILIKFADFDGGGIQINTIREDYQSPRTWTPSFIPLNIINVTDITQKDDIFSIAMTILFLFIAHEKRQSPKTSPTFIKIRKLNYKLNKKLRRNRQNKEINNEEFLTYIKNMPDFPVINELKPLLIQMLNPYRDQRPTAKYLYNHPIIKRYCGEVSSLTSAGNVNLEETSEPETKSKGGKKRYRHKKTRKSKKKKKSKKRKSKAKKKKKSKRSRKTRRRRRRRRRKR